MALIETIIALALLYGLLAVVTSAIKEMIEAWVQKRKKDLKGAIEDLLGSLASSFFSDPRVRAVNAEAVSSETDRKAGDSDYWPSYISAKTFAVVAQELLNRSSGTGGQSGSAAALVTKGASDADQVSQLEAIYEQRMDRMTGSFKRNAQKWLFFIGLILALLVDADTLRISKDLSNDAAARAAIVAVAEKLSNEAEAKKYCGIDTKDKTAKDLVACVQKAAPSVIGWSDKRSEELIRSKKAVLSALLGWLITAAAISLGAPFWFDLLNKVSNLRSTKKP
jgi:type II secretory pathway pseudopilin PulG